MRSRCREILQSSSPFRAPLLQKKGTCSLQENMCTGNHETTIVTSESIMSVVSYATARLSLSVYHLPISLLRNSFVWSDVWVDTLFFIRNMPIKNVRLK